MMDSPSETKLNHNGGLITIGVIVLLFGTATGIAWAMLAFAVLGLLVISIVFLRGAWRTLLLTVTAATATAIVSAFVVSKL